MAQQNLRARQQQKQRIMMILLFLLVAGGAAFYFLSAKPEAKKRVQAPAPKGAIAVPVARKDIPLGTRISNQMVTVMYKSPRQVPVDALLAREEFVGRFSTRPILEGQYFQNESVGIEGAVGGFSAMATPGKRLIVINANLFPGSLETLKVGDHVDLLAFQGFKASSGNSGRGAGQRRNSGAVDGAQPGNATGRTRRSATSTPGNQLTNPVSPANATLIAENAEVMSVPSMNRNSKKAGSFIVFQMSPQDAHVTTLMVASDVLLRAVFRPFGDNTRLTSDNPPSITTRLPKAVLDPELIQVIADGKTYATKPNSKIFLSEEEAQALQMKDAPNVIYGKSKAVGDKSGSANTSETITKDEELVEPSETTEEGVKQPLKSRKSAKVSQDQISATDDDSGLDEVY